MSNPAELAQTLLAYGRFRPRRHTLVDRALIERALQPLREMNATGWITEERAATRQLIPNAPSMRIARNARVWPAGGQSVTNRAGTLADGTTASPEKKRKIPPLCPRGGEVGVRWGIAERPTSATSPSRSRALPLRPEGGEGNVTSVQSPSRLMISITPVRLCITSCSRSENAIAAALECGCARASAFRAPRAGRRRFRLRASSGPSEIDEIGTDRVLAAEAVLGQ